METSRLIALLLFLAGSTAADVKAQMYLPAFHVRIHSGYTLPVTPSEFTKYYRLGPNVGGIIGYRLPSGWEFGASGYWTGFDLSEGKVIDENSSGNLLELHAGSGDATMLSGFAEVRYHWQVKPRNSVYAVGGVGIRKWRRDEVSVLLAGDTPEDEPEEFVVIEEQKETKPAALVGVGATAALTRLFHIFLEVQADVTFTEETMFTVPVKAGLVIHLTR